MAYEVYNVKVQTLLGQDMGSARLYFGLNHSRGRSYYYSTIGIQDIQTQYRSDTGVTMDLNGLSAYSAQDPVNLNTAGPWSGMGPFLNHRFTLPAHTQSLRYIFKTGSYIEIDAVVYRQSENDYYCMYRYYTKTGALVISGSINCRTWDFSYDIARSCSTYCMPWKGFSEGNYYYFVGPQVTGSTNPVGTAITMATSSASKSLADQFFNGLDPDDADDPYPDVPDSEPDEPDDPDGIPDDDPIDIPDIPTIEVTDTGFITLFSPTLTQLKNLASYMWSSLFDLASFRKIFADPMDCILGLNILPFSVSTGAAASVSVGNISTGVQMNTLASQWVTLNCGTLNIGKIYDSYLDFAPYCKWSIYLPFIGVINLNTDDVAHQTLNLVYHIDVLSCACVAYLKAGDHVLYQFSGTCGYEIPVTSNNFASMIANMVAIGATVVSAGLTAAGTAAAASAAEGIASAGSVSAHNVMGLKPDVKRGGSLGSAASFLSMKTPYVILEVPNMCKPSRQPHYTGYPAYVTRTVGSVSGYVEFDSIVVNGLPCTDTERQMVEDILKGGAYV